MFKDRELPQEFVEYSLEERMASDARIAIYCAESAMRLKQRAALEARPHYKREMALQVEARRKEVVDLATTIEACLMHQARLSQAAFKSL